MELTEQQTRFLEIFYRFYQERYKTNDKEYRKRAIICYSILQNIPQSFGDELQDSYSFKTTSDGKVNSKDFEKFLDSLDELDKQSEDNKAQNEDNETQNNDTYAVDSYWPTNDSAYLISSICTYNRIMPYQYPALAYALTYFAEFNDFQSLRAELIRLDRLSESKNFSEDEAKLNDNILRVMGLMGKFSPEMPRIMANPNLSPAEVGFLLTFKGFCQECYNPNCEADRAYAQNVIVISSYLPEETAGNLNEQYEILPTKDGVHPADIDGLLASLDAKQEDVYKFNLSIKNVPLLPIAEELRSKEIKTYESISRFCSALSYAVSVDATEEEVQKYLESLSEKSGFENSRVSIRRRIDENIVLILEEFGIITQIHRYPGEQEKPLKYPAERIPGPFQKLKRALTKKENKDRQTTEK